jgi:competence protein ComEC
MCDCDGVGTDATGFALPAVGFDRWSNAALSTAVLSPYDLRLITGDAPQLATLRGMLRETPAQRVFVQDEKESWRTVAQVELTAIRLNRQNWQPARGRVAITTPGALTNFFAGQIVEVFGVLRLPKLAAAEGTFDYRKYLKELGIYYQLEAGSEQDWQIISSPAHPPLADRFRNWAREALAVGLPGEDESLRLEWALTLGWKPALTEEVSEPFVRAATYHIFAVDGLRMAIIFGIFFGLLRAMGLPRGMCGVMLIPLLWFYTALTGWPASAIRAAVMLSVVVTGWMLKRPTNLMNSLFAAALLILIWQPHQLFQAGFQLSFCVVLCMLLAMPILQEVWALIWAPDPLLPEYLQPRWRNFLRMPGRFVGGLVMTSFAAWLGSIPLVAYYFHILTPVSTPANLLAVPLCGLVLMSNFGSLIVASWFPGAALLFNHAGWFLMECIRVSSHWFARLPRGYFYVSEPTLLGGGLYYALLVAVLTGWLFRPAFRRWRFAGTGAAVAVWACFFWHDVWTTRLHVVPVNGGIAHYFDAPGIKDDLLVDCGSTNSVMFITKPFLRGQGVNRLNHLVLSHGDIHHVGGARLVAELFKIQKVCVSPARARSAAYRQLLKEFSQSPEKVRTLQRNDRLGAWTVLHPDASDHFARADDNALVLSGNLEGTRILLLSDLGEPGQQSLVERTADLRADIVITGLPVQPEALCDALLDKIQPRLIIVADSEFPVWERAGAGFSERLARRKTPVIYTRSAGAATITFHKNRWEVRTISGLRLKSENTSAKDSPSPGPEPRN